jgi:hypothetical protein
LRHATCLFGTDFVWQEQSHRMSVFAGHIDCQLRGGIVRRKPDRCGLGVDNERSRPGLRDRQDALGTAQLAQMDDSYERHELEEPQAGVASGTP